MERDRESISPESGADIYTGTAFCRGMWILFSAPAPLILRSVLFFSKKPGDRSPEDRDTSVYGYVTAASTHPEFPYGYVLHKCKLTSDCPKGSVYLDVPGKNGQKRYFWSANWENIFILRAGWTGERPTDISITESTIPMAPGQVLKRERIFPISLPEKRRSSIPWKKCWKAGLGNEFTGKRELRRVEAAVFHKVE